MVALRLCLRSFRVCHIRVTHIMDPIARQPCSAVATAPNCTLPAEAPALALGMRCRVLCRRPALFQLVQSLEEDLQRPAAARGEQIIVNFAFSEEQEELRKSVRRFLEDKSPETEVRRLMETDEGYDAAVWPPMAQQLGLEGLAIPEECGGSGYSYVELIVVLEEMGRALLCAPYFSTVALAANALLVSGDDDAKKEYLPSIASGETIATLAFTEDSGRWDEAGITMEATKSSDGYRLNGHKMFVIDGHTANLIIVAARRGDGIVLFAVEGDAPGLTRTPVSTMD